MSSGPQKRLFGLLFLTLLFAVIGYGCNACNKSKARQPETKKTPTLRLYVLGGAAGAIEPCGCVKDMLGGVDHAAAYLESQAREAPNRLVVGAGPMLFSDPELQQAHRAQAGFKAQALAESFKDIGLSAWAPGVNDWALGSSKLDQLRRLSGAALLAGNLDASATKLSATLLEKTGDVSVGLCGVLVSAPRPGLPSGLDFQRARETLLKAHEELTRKRVQLKVALLAAPRGDALRLLESVPGFQVAVVGKALDQGEHNDEPIAPTIVGDTLVVQAPNHLQGIASVDLFVRGDDFEFQDATGIEQMARRESLERRIQELQSRLREWEASGASSADLQARRGDLKRLEAELASLPTLAPPAQGSFYRYELVDVREGLGVDSNVKQRLVAYYKRVNEHNQEVFKDKAPPPVAEGNAGYLGAEQCAACHIEAYQFWKGTRHAGAYEALVKDHKQFNLECVSCHVTGYEKPGGATVTHVKGLTDVQCEVCHGPGSLHLENPADKSLIERTPERTFCAQTCHHPPHVKKDWSVDEAWQKILGEGHGR